MIPAPGQAWDWRTSPVLIIIIIIIIIITLIRYLGFVGTLFFFFKVLS